MALVMDKHWDLVMVSSLVLWLVSKMACYSVPMMVHCLDYYLAFQKAMMMELNLDPMMEHVMVRYLDSLMV